ncbi:F1/F0 ATPase, subunit 2 [Bradyrhizobium canariense]|uniref:F1/F0 ATPase, subunit 2 n=2 Tax=Bradyrhizobium canariense TaxID=255045 RepID=A0A1H1SV56_9BRAD|nr:F1/F0 ATPase, subunit 2 [Bradyrhizobium canariense]
MTSLSFASLSPGAMVLDLAGHFVAGLLLGLVYFRSLWWNARLFVAGERVVTTIGLMLGRFVLLGGLLTLVSFEGALPLLVMALGILIARSVFMRRVGEAAL